MLTCIKQKSQHKNKNNDNKQQNMAKSGYS